MPANRPPPPAGPEPWRNPWRRPGAARRRVRWGYGDAVWVAVAGIVVSIPVAAISVGIRHPDRPGVTDAVDTVWSAAGQFAAMLGLALLLLRFKGWRATRDVGLDRPTLRDLRFVGLGVVAAIVLQLASAPAGALWSAAGYGGQAVGEDLQRATGLTTAVFVVIIVVVVPITEELLFRGIVLRASLRHFDAVPSVLIAGLVFGGFHLLDPNTLPSVPALAAIGTITAIAAVRTGRLVPAIALHAGFNLLGAVALLVSR